MLEKYLTHQIPLVRDLAKYWLNIGFPAEIYKTGFNGNFGVFFFKYADKKFIVDMTGRKGRVLISEDYTQRNHKEKSDIGRVLPTFYRSFNPDPIKITQEIKNYSVKFSVLKEKFRDSELNVRRITTYWMKEEDFVPQEVEVYKVGCPGTFILYFSLKEKIYILDHQPSGVSFLVYDGSYRYLSNYSPNEFIFNLKLWMRDIKNKEPDAKIGRNHELALYPFTQDFLRKLESK